MVFQGGGLHGCPGWGIAWLSRVGVAWLFRVGGCMVVRGGGVMVVRGGGCHGCPEWGVASLSRVGGCMVVQCHPTPLLLAINPSPSRCSHHVPPTPHPPGPVILVKALLPVVDQSKLQMKVSFAMCQQ